MSDRKTGTVKWFDTKKGYGFIELEGSEDIFVHFSAITEEGYKSLRDGQAVEFDVESEGGKDKAKNVTKID